jgi:hypothetical protein
MRNGVSNKTAKGQSEEEVAKFWLTHDSTDYVDESTMEMPNLHRADHLVRVAIPDDEYGQLSQLATARKKSLAETIGLLVKHSLKELGANPAMPL